MQLDFEDWLRNLSNDDDDDDNHDDDDHDDDMIYYDAVSVCHEKSSLPPGSLL